MSRVRPEKTMRTPHRLLAALALLCAAAAAGEPPARDVRQPAAIVGTEVITRSDVLALIGPELEAAETRLAGGELAAERKRLAAEGLKRLIQEKLFTLEGRRLEQENAALKSWAEREVERLQREQWQRFGGRLQYEAWLSKHDISLKQDQANMKDFVLRSFVVERFIAQEAYAAPSEVRAYYEAHRDEFAAPRQVAYRQLFVPSADFESPEKARERAQWIQRGLAPDGHDFADWVKKHSQGPRAAQGGLWDLGERSTNDEALQARISALEVGAISEPLAGPGGFYLVRVEKVAPAHHKTLYEVQDEIKGRLLDRNRREKLDELEQQLRTRFAVDESGENR